MSSTSQFSRSEMYKHVQMLSKTQNTSAFILKLMGAALVMEEEEEEEKISNEKFEKTTTN